MLSANARREEYYHLAVPTGPTLEGNSINPGVIIGVLRSDRQSAANDTRDKSRRTYLVGHAGDRPISQSARNDAPAFVA